MDTFVDFTFIFCFLFLFLFLSWLQYFLFLSYLLVQIQMASIPAWNIETTTAATLDVEVNNENAVIIPLSLLDTSLASSQTGSSSTNALTIAIICVVSVALLLLMAITGCIICAGTMFKRHQQRNREKHVATASLIYQGFTNGTIQLYLCLINLHEMESIVMNAFFYF